MNTIWSLTQTYFIVLILIFTFSGVGLHALTFRNKKYGENVSLKTITFGITTTLSFLLLTMFFLGYLGINLRPPLFTLFVFLFLIAFYGLLKNRKTIRISLSILVGATLIGIWNLIPIMLIKFHSGSQLGMVTKGNNDIAYYVAIAGEFLKSGFTNSNHLAGVDLNLAAKVTPYFTPDAIISFIAASFHIEVWQAAMPASILGLSFSALALARLTQTVFSELNIFRSMLISTIVLLTPVVSYVFNHFFLGQVFALGISALVLSNLIDFFWNNHKSRILLFEIGSLFVLSLFTYPAFLIPFIFAALFFVCASHGISFRTVRIPGMIRYLFAILCGAAISLPYIPYAYRMSQTLKDDVFGWPLPPFNSLGMFVWPDLLGYKMPVIWIICSWLPIAALIFLILKQFTAQKPLNYRIIYLISFLIIFIFAFIQFNGEGYEAYRSWKLISFIAPLALTLMLAVVSVTTPVNKIAIAFMLGLVLTGSAANWAPRQPGVQFTGQDLEDLAQNKKISNLATLNIDLNPFFETMAVSSIISKPVLFFNSTSYLSTSQNPTACTLVRRDNLRYTNIQPLNLTYGVVASEKEGCDPVSLEVSPGEVVYMDSTASPQYWEGWGNPEDWGTWTIEPKAQIPLTLKDFSPIDASLNLSSKAFLSSTHKTLTCIISVNGVKLKSHKYDLANNGKTIRVTVPKELLFKNQGKIIFDLEIQNPNSPKNLGLSEDARNLGIGLFSFSVTQDSSQYPQ